MTADASMNFAALTNYVEASGLYAVGTRVTDVTDILQLRKWNAVSAEWDTLAAPASLPVSGPQYFAWAQDAEYLAAGVLSANPNNLIIYKRTGDTFAALALTDRPPNQGYGVAFDSVTQRLAVGNGNSGEGLYIYDFVGEDLTGGKTVFFNDVARQIAFQSGVGSRYVAVGTDSGIYVIACTETPMRVAAQLLYSTDPKYQADKGLYWDASDSYLIGVGGRTPAGAGEQINVYNFDGSVIGMETLTLESTATEGPATAASDSSLTADGRYLIVAYGAATAYVYDLSGPLPPTLDRIADLPASAGSVNSVSWTNFTP
jgi:hypothetical protein